MEKVDSTLRPTMGAKDKPVVTSFTGMAYEKHSRALDRFLLRRLRNSEDAREVAQEVWTRLLRVARPESVIEPLAYVHRTAANVLAEFRMRRHRDVVDFDSDASDFAAENPGDAVPHELVDRLSTQLQVQNALATLPSLYRQILLMRLCEGLSYRDIGGALGLTAGTTEKYFFRAMSAMRTTRWD